MVSELKIAVVTYIASTVARVWDALINPESLSSIGSILALSPTGKSAPKSFTAETGRSRTNKPCSSSSRHMS